jgi:hypothetical protein
VAEALAISVVVMVAASTMVVTGSGVIVEVRDSMRVVGMVVVMVELAATPVS